ncbi:hypothetical protein [Candidatus Thiodictyon syntrophicum]|jgi:hypothetical protein|uniref:Uncharacterized protein n=1 Tax=Candidatus Thiodictyon syntrophicum TaxID=1166950 RepID=A0A2K8U4V1_9GAMM|nr:hypothetical protein [Candidatus Thiodictyon syntrophicum]AUB80616.1 hypothetical protein THSYN_06390 [Candidatus Thiodictyon syntrophicum]
MDYETLARGRLRLRPATENLPYWKADYAKMKGPMFFGEAPDFDEILRIVGEFQDRFNDQGRHTD